MTYDILCKLHFSRCYPFLRWLLTDGNAQILLAFILQNASLSPTVLDCIQLCQTFPCALDHLSNYVGICPATLEYASCYSLGNMSNYVGICPTTLMHVQLHWNLYHIIPQGIYPTTLKHVQLYWNLYHVIPWGICPTTLEYVQLL